MSQIIADNVDVACYYATKHSWRGKYKRLFAVGTKAVTTYNPTSLEITNQWSYNDFAGILPDSKAKSNNEFVISLRKTGKKNETMRFSCDFRENVITETLRHCKMSSDSYHKIKRFNARKQHWSETHKSVILEVAAGSIRQIHPTNNTILSTYDYMDIESFAQVSDLPGGVAVVTRFGRMHLFSCAQAKEFIDAGIEAAIRNVGVHLKRKANPVTMEQFMHYRFGNYSDDEHVTSLAEFQVQKMTGKTAEPVRRTLCLSETCILERDPLTYSIVTLRPQSEIFALVRCPKNPQLFTIEYCRGGNRKYLSTDRDSLLATLLDGVRASGNRDICVKMTPTNLGQRLGPLYIHMDEDVESMHLKFFQQPPNGNFNEAISRFNNCVQYSGLLWAVKQDGFFAENKEKLISTAILSLTLHNDEKFNDQEVEMKLHALRRLVASKAGFSAITQINRFRENLGLLIVGALKRDNDSVSHAAIDVLSTLLCPMHDNYDLRQEQFNKQSLLSSKSFLERLLNNFADKVKKGKGALVISAMLDFLSFSLCSPYSETTDGKSFEQLLQLVANLGRSFYRLFQHPSLAIVKGAGLVMKAIIEEGDSTTAANMQELALAEGALPRHLQTAMFSLSSDTRLLTNRQLSRHLVGLWVTGHPPAMTLLKRILPPGLLSYLDSEEKVPKNEADLLNVRDNLKSAIDQSRDDSQWRKIDRQLKQFEQLVSKKADVLVTHWRDRIGIKRAVEDQQRPIVLRKRRQNIKTEANWPYFYYQFNQDHARPNLIWNHKTREELRTALENEIRAFQVDRELGNQMEISWNHAEFELLYECLKEEIKIGDYYLRLLLDDEIDQDSLVIKRSYEFYNDLYHRFLLTPQVKMKCMCLKAMTIVYGKCWEDIGPFNDTKYIVGMLQRCNDRQERDCLILFIEKLIKHKQNVKEILDAKDGIKVLVDFISLAHLHKDRAHVPTQTNVIEASEEMMERMSGEKEWYFGNKDKERLGPFSLKEMEEHWNNELLTPRSRCWAQGMESWKPLQKIAQLKWTFMATGNAEMNETDLAKTVLNMLISICRYYPSRDANDAVIRPLPRVKTRLSEAACLPHIVQLLLTFDPILVEKVAVLLYEVMEDNPLLSRAYLTGVFYFILMYTGSNIIPKCKFLKYLHLKQAFRSKEEKASDMVARSILGSILPEAMIHYLENYGAEKFSEIFLGEFDTPEAIWNNQMRRYMIEKISSHIADFTPRLYGNVKAVYVHFPIPSINYPDLEDELFCNIYYLRHLCNETKFPEWDIKNPVEFLKDVLIMWKEEVNKKGSSMSYDEAYETLRLPKEKGPFTESQVKKAYFKMAQKYHPDKNPEGREIFEAVYKAYEFLCSKKKRVIDGPDPQDILLILKTQSILFRRYKEELKPYKYAGYPALINTITLEADDENLFRKEEPLLVFATELAYHTVNCSALNAEELRRENGIEVLQSSFSRCVTMLGTLSKPDDIVVQVCTHVARCYTVAAAFNECREKFMEDKNIIKDLIRILNYSHLPQLCSVAVECVSAFALDVALQSSLYTGGVVWHLLLYLFNYDYTLEEGGVQKSEASNQQEVANRLARLSINALACMGGFLTKDGANAMMTKTLNALITPYLTKQLAAGSYAEVLKILNSNTQTPYLMWDNGTRTELTEYLKEQQKHAIGTEGCDESYGADFVFSLHQKELIVGEIFVRIYNEQPTFPIEEPMKFANALLDYLGSKAEYVFSFYALQNNNKQQQQEQKKQQQCLLMFEPQQQQPNYEHIGDTSLISSVFNQQPHNGEVSQPTAMVGSKLTDCMLALQGLSNVIKSYSDVQSSCIGHFKMLFSFLQHKCDKQIRLLALEAISTVVGNKLCVENISDSSVLPFLLSVLHTLPAGQALALEILENLSSNTKIVRQVLNQGGLIYLLDLYCNETHLEVRTKTAELFAKLLSDKLVGPRVLITLQKFLPSIFMDAMRDSAEQSVHMFEASHENPELIWQDDTRESVCQTVKNMADQFFKAQSEKAEATWTIPRNFVTAYHRSGDDDNANEIIVGGVYLRLFIAQPSWVLRKPREFIVEIMDKFTKLISSTNPDGESLETVTQAVCCLFAVHPQFADHVPSLGHLPDVFKGMMNGNNDSIPKASLSLIHVLSNNETCAMSFSECECIKSMITAMKTRPDQISLACEAFHRIFTVNRKAAIMSQVIKCRLVSYLLNVLDTGLTGVENAGSSKAQIVKTLKSMTGSLEYGEEIEKELSESSVWAAYKDQMHDLFISNTSVAGYLTGGPAVAGYLTAAPKSGGMPQAPPPMRE